VLDAGIPIRSSQEAWTRPTVGDAYAANHTNLQSVWKKSYKAFGKRRKSSRYPISLVLCQVLRSKATTSLILWLH